MSRIVFLSLVLLRAILDNRSLWSRLGTSMLNVRGVRFRAATIESDCQSFTFAAVRPSNPE
jgi:hypothetical protein